jgi:uncharacterized membrane protein
VLLLYKRNIAETLSVLKGITIYPLQTAKGLIILGISLSTKVMRFFTGLSLSVGQSMLLKEISKIGNILLLKTIRENFVALWIFTLIIPFNVPQSRR